MLFKKLRRLRIAEVNFCITDKIFFFFGANNYFIYAIIA